MKPSSTACGRVNSYLHLAAMPIKLRDVLAADEPFLFEVYASTRAEEMALVPWDEEQRKSFLRMQFVAQHSHYRDQFPAASYRVILRDNSPVGRLYVLKEKDKIRILDITLLPEHRNRGIGTALLRELLDEAAPSKKRVLIYVETFNPSLRLFARLGFKSISEEGINFLMEWRPEDGALAGAAGIPAE
jgi:ribosomal protein S18 acetylase RimI-like enzyme